MEVDINNSSLSTKDVNVWNSDYDGNGLSIEVFAIYLAMKNSKLEYVEKDIY